MQKIIRRVIVSEYITFTPLLMSINVAYAETWDLDTVWAKFQDMIQNLYGPILAVSTLLAVTTAAIALISRMVSSNQKTVDSCDSWLKNIVIAWIILNSVGTIIAFMSPYLRPFIDEYNDEYYSAYYENSELYDSDTEDFPYDEVNSDFQQMMDENGYSKTWYSDDDSESESETEN